MSLIIGSHVSFKKDNQLVGSVEEALSYNANAFMFYTGAPQNTMRYPISVEITKKAQQMMENKIDINNVLVHAPYIINLANPNNTDFGIRFLNEEINRCESLGVKKIILHPGSHVGLGREEGIKNIVFCLDNVKNKNVFICLETMAGKGSEIGTIEDIKEIMNRVKDSSNLLVCLDTCHLNDFGYDISKFDVVLDKMDELIGIEKIGCIHINDSKNVQTSHKDRHENIGYGTIGFDNLISVIYNKRLESVPKILETPYINEKAPYKYEIEMIRSKKFNENLVKDILAN